MAAPGWYPDPSGRFDHRWHDGKNWTSHVQVNGINVEDPVPDHPRPTAVTPPAPGPPPPTPSRVGPTADGALPAPGVATSRSRLPGWAKIAVFAAVVLILLAVVAALLGRGDTQQERSESDRTAAQEAMQEPRGGGSADRATTTTARPTTTTTEAPSTTEVPPPPPTEPPPPPEPVVFEGTGPSVVTFIPPDPAAPSVAGVTHSGSRNFVVWELDGDLERSDLLINTIGNYAGTVGIGWGTTPGALQIEADGPWRIEVWPIVQATTIDGAYSGRGDDVLIWTGEPTAMTVMHAGQRTLTPA